LPDALVLQPSETSAPQVPEKTSTEVPVTGLQELVAVITLKEDTPVGFTTLNHTSALSVPPGLQAKLPDEEAVACVVAQVMGAAPNVSVGLAPVQDNAVPAHPSFHGVLGVQSRK
jgi:hypothetical protein